jgi:hypothetical protein
MQTALIISLWAYLFCLPLSEPGQVFGWLRNLIYQMPEWLFNPLIGCPKCHAGQIALWYQVWQATHGRGFDISFILVCIGGAYALSTWHQIVEKHLNR